MANLIFEWPAENSLNTNQEHGLCNAWARTFVTSNPTPRAGTYCMRAENRGNVPNDGVNACSQLGGNGKHRNETVMRYADDSSTVFFSQGTEYWIGFSTQFQADWPTQNTITWQLIFGGAGPHVHAQANSGNWEILRSHSGGTQKVNFPLVKGEWLDCVIRFKIAAGGGGLLEFWVNNVKKVSMLDVPIGYAGENPYFKFGSYWGTADRGSEVYVNYFDAVRIAQGTSGFDLVNPAAYDEGPPPVGEDPAADVELRYCLDNLTGTGLLSDHTADEGAGAWQNATTYQLTGDGKVKPVGSGQNLAYHNTTPPSADQTVIISFVVGNGGTNPRVEVYCRCLVSGSNTGYFARLMAGVLNLRRIVAGSASSLTSVNVGTFSATQAYELRLTTKTTAGNVDLTAVLSSGGETVATATYTDSATTRILDANFQGFMHVDTSGIGYVDWFDAQLPQALGVVANPVISPSSATYEAPLVVTITTATAGATTYYTIDGSAPDETDTEYTTALELEPGAYTIKAIALAPYYGDSQRATATYVVTETVTGEALLDNFTEASSTALDLHIGDSGDGWAGQSDQYTVGAGTGQVRPNGTGENLALSNAVMDSNHQLVRVTGDIGDASGGANRRIEARCRADLLLGNHHGYFCRAFPSTQKLRLHRINNGSGQFLAETNATIADATEYTVELEVEDVAGDPALTGKLYDTDGTTVLATVANTDTDQTNKITTIGKAGFLHRVDNSTGYVTKVTAEILSVPAAGTVATPTITPNGGTFNNAVEAVLACATAQSTIYYTRDGNTPTTGSTEYTASFTVSDDETVKAFAVRTNYTDSAVASADFVIEVIQTVADPEISPDGATTTVSQQVTLTCATVDAEIWYNLNGEDPSGADDLGDVLYSAPFTINRSRTIKVVALKDGMLASGVVSAVFTITPSAPVINTFTVGNRWIEIAFTPSTFPAGALPGSHQLLINDVAQEGVTYAGSTVKFDVAHANRSYDVSLIGQDAQGNISAESNTVTAITTKTALILQAEALTEYD